MWEKNQNPIQITYDHTQKFKQQKTLISISIIKFTLYNIMFTNIVYFSPPGSVVVWLEDL